MKSLNHPVMHRDMHHWLGSISFIQVFLTLLLFSFQFKISAQETIYVSNSQILSSCGEEIVMRGYNEMFIWSGDRTGAITLPEIAQTGSNAVRLVWTTEGSETEFDQLITNSIANNMVPVAELHDATGDFSKLQLLLDYWKRPAVLDIIQKHKKWLIVNIGNEVGNGSESVQQWVDYYKDAITQLRNAGIDTPLMIDCGGWGNQERYFLEGGQELLEFDPLNNIIFSVHTYWTNGGDADKIQRLNTMIADAQLKNLPFIIGEGPQLAASPIACGQLFPYDQMIQILETEQIGWLSWSWGLVNNNDCGSPNSVFDVTTNGLYGNWATTFGEEISVTDPNSIQNTSVIPPSLISGTNCGNTNPGNTYTVRARGLEGTEQISLVINNQTIETWTLSTTYSDYSVNSSVSGTARISYINDAIERDVQIDYLIVNGETFESEDQAINTGVYQGQCGGSFSEWINCTGYIEYSGGGASPIAVTGVTITPSTLTLNEGETADLTATVLPTNATNTTVKWSTNNASIATISNTGLVTALNAGSADITVTTDDGAFTATTSLTVNTNSGSACSSPTMASLPFSFDGAGSFCWELSGNINYINSWGTESVSINGVDYSNLWSNSMPDPINGKYYVEFSGNHAWSHFEAVGTNAARTEMTKLQMIGNDNSPKEITVYPIPSSGNFKIRQNYFNDGISIEIFTASGKRVFVKRELISNPIIELDTYLDSGIYLLMMTDGIESYQKRIVIR